MAPWISYLWKALRLDLLGVLRTPTMKESQLLREKTTSSVFVSTCSNPVHMPSFIDLHTHATAGHVTSFACTKLHSTCSPNTSDRSLAWSHHTITKIYAIHIHRDRAETWNTSGKPRAVAWPDWGEAMAICSQDLDSHYLVMTGQMHDDQGPVEEEGRDGGGVGW